VIAGLDFLLVAALWALPLAALPVMLHLLFRRKTPVVMFSTIRFLKQSARQTAARRKIRQWGLLACRAGLLALLIGAAAQPRTRPAAAMSAAPRNLAAVIVVDTSYSMQLRDRGMTLLSRANSMIQELLAGALHDARVAIFRSSPPNAADPQAPLLAAQEAGELGSRIRWTPLVAHAARHPLVNRVAEAVELLRRLDAAEQRLIVISDFQEREFPRPLPPCGRAVAILLDLHPAQPRSAGVTRVAIEPPRPMPGIGSEVLVEVAGQAGSEPLVVLTIGTLDGRTLQRSDVRAARVDSSGFGRVRFPVRLPAERWLVLTASLQQDDDMPWDNTRTTLVEVPGRSNVALMSGDEFPAARKFLRLALDPSEGRASDWPLAVRERSTFDGSDDAAVAVVSSWPDAPAADRLLSFVRGGGTLIWFIRPGLQDTWSGLGDAQKHALGAMLPGEPATDGLENPSSAGVATMTDPLLDGLSERRFQIGQIVAQRFVPFSAIAPQTQTLLSLLPLRPSPGMTPFGLLYRRSVGAGTAYTFATVPDGQFTNLATHPIFLPLLVGMALHSREATAAQNVELGEPVSASGHDLEAVEQLWVHGPDNATYPGRIVNDAQGRRFVFDGAMLPGIYKWSKPGEAQILTATNVQPPAAESRLAYRSPAALAPAGSNVIVARSLDELNGKLAALGEPKPRWPIPVALVMVLLCIEAMVAQRRNTSSH